MRKDFALPVVAVAAMALAACSVDRSSGPQAEAVKPNLHNVIDVCDFITFGRLEVTGANGETIVISGNAGGNKPGGGFLGQVEIHAAGTTYHLDEVTEYGIALDPPVFGANPSNLRVVAGFSREGPYVNLHLIDNPDPGQGEPGTQEGDMVWLGIDKAPFVPGPEDYTLGPVNVTRGNIQLHDVCRGPKT
jgi:hypothetical protein